jgi:hypothetical protein
MFLSPEPSNPVSPFENSAESLGFLIKTMRRFYRKLFSPFQFAVFDLKNSPTTGAATAHLRPLEMERRRIALPCLTPHHMSPIEN